MAHGITVPPFGFPPGAGTPPAPGSPGSFGSWWGSYADPWKTQFGTALYPTFESGVQNRYNMLSGILGRLGVSPAAPSNAPGAAPTGPGFPSFASFIDPYDEALTAKFGTAYGPGIQQGLERLYGRMFPGTNPGIFGHLLGQLGGMGRGPGMGGIGRLMGPWKGLFGQARKAGQRDMKAFNQTFKRQVQQMFR